MDAKYSKIIVRDGNGNLIQLLPEVQVATTIDINSTLPVTSSAVAAYGSEILSGIVKEVQYSTVEPTAANTEALDNGSLIFWEQTPAQAAEWTPVYLVGNQTITGAKTFTATISGSIDGNAATATRASQDASGNDIASTYATKGEMPVAYVGATSSSAGTAGLVPAATSAERDRYLRGDGTWAELTLPSDYVGATSSANGTHGLVPAATSAQRNHIFYGDGTWKNPNFAASVAISASQIDPSLGNIFTKTISANTTFTIASIPSGSGAVFTLVLTNGGSKIITWPSTVKWADGIPPTLTSSGKDVLTFLTSDGGNTWYGTAAVIGAA